jgi:hypothetical protein
MNVLLFVSTLIMLMAMLTYARLESYRNFSLMQSRFMSYMEKTERGTINLAAEEAYDVIVEKKGSHEASKKSKALSRLSIVPFLDPKKQKEGYPELLNLAKKLIVLLYKDQPFFEEMAKKRPDFLDAFFIALRTAVSKLPKEKQVIKKAEDLSQLNLEDDALNTFSYYIFNGTMDKEQKKPGASKQSLPLPEDGGEDDDVDREPGKNEEHKSPQGYYSFLDFITMQEASKVRVFLTSPQLLLAIFDDPSIVRSIMETRKMLYQKVTKEGLSAEAASEQFKSQFAPGGNSSFSQILDFSVSKTNPKNYE